jgi:hypothetical protein
MEKQTYIKPEITVVRIDNNISVLLMSDGQGFPPGLPPDLGQTE